MSDAPLAYTVGEVAQMLGVVSTTTVRSWADEGLLESYRTPRGQRRFSREQLDWFLDQLRRSTGQEDE